MAKPITMLYMGDYDAIQDGILLSLAARFPLSTSKVFTGIFNGDNAIDEFRSRWSAFEDCLRSGAEITVAILHAVQIGVSAWFELRSSIEVLEASPDDHLR